MKQKEVIHAIILIITIALGFIIPKTQLVDYDLHLTAGLFLFFYLVQKLIPQRTNLLQSVVFTLIITLIINSTGGAASPFFFLIYFLLFSLALLLEPTVSLTTSLTFIVFFIIFIPTTENFKDLLPIFSLAFLTPFSLYLGRQYLLLQKAKKNLNQTKEETFLFLSLILKTHLKNIRIVTENFIGDHQLESIKKSINRMEKLIEKFEKSQ
jgi:hypothetical protein